jgi:N-acetylglucosaminyl-diphospho-decaprenol L-rhamnosyltransferase
VSEGVPIRIAVVSWNTRDLLARCLESMRAEVDAGRAAVTVVDNGSNDGSRELVRSGHPWAELIESDENLGFGRAINLVAERSDSTWLAAANADIELTPGALQTLMEVGEQHPEAGPIAPRLILPDGSIQHSVHSFPSPALAAFFAVGAYRLSRRLGDRLCIDGYWDSDRRREVDWARGAFLLIRRRWFEQVGGFDESQWLYAEDIDLAWRLKRSGHPVRYEPRAVVHHVLSAATRKAFDEYEMNRRHVDASYAWLARRRGPGVARLTAAIGMVGAALRVLIFTPLARLDPERWSGPRELARRYVSLHRHGLRVGTPDEAR